MWVDLVTFLVPEIVLSSDFFWKLVHEIVQFKISSLKHNRLNVGRIALERRLGALINCSLFQPGESLNGTKKFYSGLQITTLEVNIYHY